MIIAFWSGVFILSLLLLIKGSDWLLESSEKIGLKIGISPFIVGATIVAVSTSLPELVSSIFSVFSGLNEFPVANAVGSNIANILLIIGLSTLFAKKLQVAKDLIDLDLPMLFVTTSIFLLVAYDGTIYFYESLFLLITYVIYLGFSLIYKTEEDEEKVKIPKITTIDILKLIVGSIGLAVGAKYLVDSVIAISESGIVPISAGVITITAVAVGTSLPEVFVSVKAAMKRKSEVALGNILGSNIFNVLVVVGLPGMFGFLTVDKTTLTIGLPVLLLATVLFIVSGISRRIHIQEGVMFLLIYVIFTLKLFGF